VHTIGVWLVATRRRQDGRWNANAGWWKPSGQSGLMWRRPIGLFATQHVGSAERADWSAPRIPFTERAPRCWALVNDGPDGTYARSQPTYRPFLIEVACLACALDGHSLPAGDDPEVAVRFMATDRWRNIAPPRSLSDLEQATLAVRLDERQ